MPISNAKQIGGCVYIYDQKGSSMNVAGRLINFDKNTVKVEHAGYEKVYDDKGKLISSRHHTTKV